MGMGLRLKPSKTRIVHTLNERNGQVGFDFLGFHIRQYRVGKDHTRTFRNKPGFKTIIKPSREAQKRHAKKVKDTTRQYRGSPQAARIPSPQSCHSRLEELLPNMFGEESLCPHGLAPISVSNNGPSSAIPRSLWAGGFAAIGNDATTPCPSRMEQLA